MGAPKLNADIGDIWQDEAIAFYLDDHTMQETLKFINEKYPVSDRSLRSLLKERGINRGVSGAQSLKRLKCHCLICRNDFVGRTPTAVMCDGCVGPNAAGATKDRLRKYAYYRRISAYGLAVDEYEELCRVQEHRCGLCKKKMKQPCIDHCHKSGKVRGLLCHRCNLLLGQVELSGRQDWLFNAMSWIQRG